MKKLISLLLLLALCTCGLFACNKDDTPEGMQNVSTENALFDLFVPLTWIPQNGNGISGASVASSDASNVTVVTTLPDELIDVDTYWQEHCLPEYKNGVLEDFSLVEDAFEDTTLGGKNAKKYVFTYTLDDEVYETMQIITVANDGLIYTLTYTAPSDKYNEHLEDVESIRANFRFR